MSKSGRILLSGGLVLATGAYAWWDHATKALPALPAPAPVLLREPVQTPRPAPQPPAPLSDAPPRVAQAAPAPQPAPERKTQKTKAVQTAIAAVPAQSAAPALPALPVSPTPPAPAAEPLQALQLAPPPAVSTGRYSDGEFVGDSIDTEWGPVQVKIVVRNGDIVDAICIIFPIHRQRSEEISEWAIPILREEAIKAQSEKIDMVSQASFTTEGYQMSLGSALTRAAKK